MINHSLQGFISLGFGLVCGLFLGYWLCGRGQIPTSSTTIEVDTTKYYKPIPTPNNELSSFTLQLPKLIFAPADTVVNTIVQTERGDSVKVSFPIEQRVYQDSTYKAVISGAVVGNRRPTLDYIETYNRTTTSEVALKPKKVRPYVGASVGVFGNWSVGVKAGFVIQEQHSVGLEYERMQYGDNLKLNYSYIFNKHKKRNNENNRK